jgi:hypothetical protein
VTDHKRPLTSALELVVYAPIGFALEARQLLPSFVERGRNQVTMAKMIGQFAVKQGQVEAEKRFAGIQKRADEVLGDLGRRDDDAGAAPAAAAPSTPASAPVRQSGADAAALAITDYDSLAASQVIPRLEGLDADELAAVARYETAHRGRKTILGKISQLQAD